MKKRLRKKRHLGEHAERGRQIIIARNRKDGFDDFLDAFVREAIEGKECLCGGGGKEGRLDVIVEFGKAADDCEARIRGIRAWLDARGDIAAYRVGPEFDPWQGDCPEPSLAEGAMVAAQENAI